MGKKSRRREKGTQGHTATSPTRGANESACANNGIFEDDEAQERVDRELDTKLEKVILEAMSGKDARRGPGARAELMQRFFHILGVDLTQYDDNAETFHDPDQASRMKRASRYTSVMSLRYWIRWDLIECRATGMMRLERTLAIKDDGDPRKSLSRLEELRAAELKPAMFESIKHSALQPPAASTPKHQGLSDLACFCSIGNAELVEKVIVKLTTAGSEERKQLIERKETCFRLTPLHIATLFATWSPTMIEYVKVVNVLLSFGANPFAKDIWGYTVLHYATDRKYIMFTCWVPNTKLFDPLADDLT